MITHWFRRRRYLRFTRNVAGAIRRRLVQVAVLFLAVFALHVAAMMAFEGLGLGEAMWLTMTTATTVGYGDVSAQSAAGRLATAVCMYLCGIFLLAQAASDLFDFRALRRERRRRGEFKWRNMKDHLLIINTPAHDAEAYLHRLVEHVRETPSLADIPVQLLTHRYPDGLPQALVELGVTHYSGVAENSENLAAANAAAARHILVIADEPHEARSDAHTYDILSRLRTLSPSERATGGHRVVVAEVVDDDNRQRIRVAGATTVLRPLRAYPEMVVRALSVPGAEALLETLFTHDADGLARFNAPFRSLVWADLLVAFIRCDAGLPMGYVEADGNVVTNPAPGATCTGAALLVLVDETLDVTDALVERALRDAASPAPPNQAAA